MKKLILILTSQLLWGDIDSIHLIGLNIDHSPFAEGSYATMYDNTDNKNKIKKYTPYKTLAIYRHNNQVKVLSLDYLLVPTVKGFKYVTNEVKERKIIPHDKENKDDDYDRSFETEYSLESSLTHAKFFNSKKEINSFMHQLKPTFKDAIIVEYESISFITPNFYITKGFHSEVTGAATWFNATETINYYPINKTKKFKKLNTKLVNFLSRKKLNNIIINVACTKEYINEKECNEDTLLPWGSAISKHEDVYFSFNYLYNNVYLQPFVRLNGNSARSFLKKGKAKIFAEINRKFNIKNRDKEAKLHFNKYAFISPNHKTKVEIVNGILKVSDFQSNKVLYAKKVQNFNKIIMSEWAFGRYAKGWKDKF